MKVVSFIPLLDLKFNFLNKRSSDMAKIFSLPNYTSILVEGVDSEKLLQGQISCDLTLDQNYFNGLFCDEKGYVITNAVVIKNSSFEIIVKKNVAQLLIEELHKFAKFFKCDVTETNKKIYGIAQNDSFTKVIDEQETQASESDWMSLTMKNFCIDIDIEYAKKYRINEIGYKFENYVSYDKGCYRGQEIIARLTYLGKRVKKNVIFEGSIDHITNSAGKKIGKKIFDLELGKESLSQFFVEDTQYFYENKKINPISSQWDLNQDQQV